MLKPFIYIIYEVQNSSRFHSGFVTRRIKFVFLYSNATFTSPIFTGPR